MKAHRYSVTIYCRKVSPFFRVDVIWRNEGAQQIAYEGDSWDAALLAALDAARGNDVHIEIWPSQEARNGT